MKTYTIYHHWDNPNYAGYEFPGAYLDRDRAIRVMKFLADADRWRREQCGDEWDADLCQNDDTYISYGFYGEGFYCDTTNVWELVEQEVIE